MAWHVFEKLLEGVANYSTLIGKLWITFFFIFRHETFRSACTSVCNQTCDVLTGLSSLLVLATRCIAMNRANLYATRFNLDVQMSATTGFRLFPRSGLYSGILITYVFRGSSNFPYLRPVVLYILYM